MFSQFIKAAKPVGAVVFTTAAYFMLQPAEDKTPMAFAYEKEAVGEVRRAVSMNFARLRVPLGARAKRRLDRRAVAMGFLARRLRGARARSTAAAARRALLEQSTSQVPALDDNGNLVVKSGMSNAH